MGCPMDVEGALGAWGGDFAGADPYALFKELRRRGPAHKVTLVDGHDAWVIVTHAEARAALVDPHLSKDMHAAAAQSSDVVAEGLPGPAFARHMLAVDPPDHTRLRRLVAGAFAASRVERLEGVVQQTVDDLLDAIEARGADTVVDLVSSFAFPMPFTVICDLLGVPAAGRAPLGDALGAMVAPTPSDEEYARAKTGSDFVVQSLTDLVAAKRQTRDDGLVSALIEARDGDDALSEQELLSTILQLIVAGHETTSTLIGNGVVALLEHPDQLAKVRSDPTLAAHAVEELIRHDSPVLHTTFRYTLEPIEIGGVTIPAGEQVLINLASASRDAVHYERPDTLDVDRTDVHHLGFGHGIHFCLGAPLARMEGRLALGTLIRRFPELRLAVPADELRWTHGDGLVLRSLSSLPVVAGRAAAG